MRVVPAVEQATRLRIHVAGFRREDAAVVEARFEDSLQGHEKRRAVVAMPVGITTRGDVRAVDQDPGLGVARDRARSLVAKPVATPARRRRPGPAGPQLQFGFVVAAETVHHRGIIAAGADRASRSAPGSCDLFAGSLLPAAAGDGAA